MISDIDVSAPLAARIPKEGVRTIRARAPAPLPQQAGVMSPPRPPVFPVLLARGLFWRPLRRTGCVVLCVRSSTMTLPRAARYPTTDTARPSSPTPSARRRLRLLPPLYISAWPAPTPPPARRPRRVRIASFVPPFPRLLAPSRACCPTPPCPPPAARRGAIFIVASVHYDDDQGADACEREVRAPGQPFTSTFTLASFLPLYVRGVHACVYAAE